MSRQGNAAGGLDLGIAVAQVFLKVITARNAFLVADDINAVGLGVVIIRGELPQGIVGDQDHEHQRDGQPEDIDGCIELVASQEVEKRAEIELMEHIIRF